MTYRNLLILFVAAAIALPCYSITAKARFANVFAEAIHKIDQYALFPVEPQALFDNAMRGMIRSLDEHSDYLAGDRFQDLEERIRQEFGGVGMYVDVNPKTQELTVTAPMPGTPAYEAGLRPGDVILTIDGEAATGRPRNESVVRLKGPVGQAVQLHVRKTNADLVDLSLVRARIPIHTALGESLVDGGQWNYIVPEDNRILYINLTEFSEQSDRELIEVLREHGARVQSLVLDLRSNGGGLLPQAIRICDLFLDREVDIVEIRGRGGRLIDPPYVASKAVEFDPRKPMVVLIDRNSASASEIVAACLQDHNRAIIAGEQSFGKGTVQNVIPLQRHRSSIKITTATYWSPSGRNLDRSLGLSGDGGDWGVRPNPGFEVELTEQELFQVDLQRNRRQYRRLDLFGPDEERKTSENEPAADAEAAAAAPQVEWDPVMLRAIQHLQEIMDRNSST